MPYTRSWTDTTPADTDQASTIGTAIRNLRTDIEERMNTLLGAGGWDTDPIGSFPKTVVRYISPSTGVSADAISTVGWFVTGVPSGGTLSMTPLPTGSTRAWDVGFSLPVGVTLTKIRAAMWRKTGASGGLINCSVGLATIVTTPTMTQIGSTSTPTANSTWVWVDAAISPHVVLVGDIFDVRVQGFQAVQGDVQYGGLELTYTVPDLLPR